jgi:carbamoyltransferase
MIILGINAYHPDASVALMKDGVLFWAGEEERFNRIKHASGFPKLALKKCLDETQTSINDIDIVAISRDPMANFFRKIGFVLQNRPSKNLISDRLHAFNKAALFKNDFCSAVETSSIKAKFIHVEHHRAHVASSFFLSGFDEAAFLSIDGMGDFSSAVWGVGKQNEFKITDRIFFPHSVGFLYTAGTQFLGFHHFGDEYKVMGLAAYGKPVYLAQFQKMIRFERRGKFSLNLDYFVHHKGKSKIRWEEGVPEQELIFSNEWQKVFGVPRVPKSELTEHYKNIAASLQAILEEVYFHVLNHLHEITNQRNLCLAGGVALNSVANGKISLKTGFKNVYVQPASNDSGTSIGAAAFAAFSLFEEKRTFMMNRADFGTAATDNQIDLALKGKSLTFEKFSESEMIQRVADALEKGDVVGWFQGRMEIGPRALGKRSILADPRRHDMKDILNQRIKHRETFRPFAPAVLEERAKEFFEMDCDSTPFMLKVFPVKKNKRDMLPAITHEDGTARVQTVSKETDPLFWKLLYAFGEKTGIPVLLNTSFNENEPIVCKPEEAIECFLKTKMDMIILSNYIVTKKHLEIES